MLNATVQIGCDAQVGPDYPGEPLGTITGEVTTRGTGTGTDADVAILWFSRSEDLSCTGLDLFCTYGIAGNEDTDPECLDSCEEPLVCSEERFDDWAACLEGCGAQAIDDGAADFGLCVDTAVGERVPVTGRFPVTFELDLFQPPPPAALLASDDGARVALGFFIAADPDAGPIVLDGGPSGIVGGSETQVLIYAAQDVAADSQWGRALGGSYETGYHVLDVIDGPLDECVPQPDGPEHCFYEDDAVAPSAADLDTKIQLVLADVDDIDWPMVLF